VPNYIALAVPFFFLLMGLEVWAARLRGVRVYRLNDAVSDLSAGIFQQIGLVFLKVGILLAYTWVFEHARILDLPSGVPTFLLALVLVDVLYYGWHRLSHEVNLLWAAHVVHHSSEEYNLAVALRQGVLTPLTSLPFYLPLAVLGIPPLAFGLADAVSTLYQFWIHTRLVGKLGSVEGVLNTPSAHRVHHGINPRYLDRNYGAILVVWDRLFGSYEPEGEEVVYGLVKPLRSFQPFRAQFHFFGELASRMSATPRLADRLRVLVKGPEWTPPGMAPLPQPEPVSPSTFVKHDPPLAAGLAPYLVVQVGIAVAGATALMYLENALPLPQLVAGAALVFVTLAGWGGFLEGRRWALPLELARLALLVGLAAFMTWGTPRGVPVVAATALLAAVLAAWALAVHAEPLAQLGQAPPRHRAGRGRGR